MTDRCAARSPRSRTVVRGAGLVRSTFSGGFSSGMTASGEVSFGGVGVVDLRLLLLIDFRRGQFDRNDRRVVADLRVRRVPPQQIAGDQRGVDADHNGRGDGPAHEIARIVVLEPGQRACGHWRIPRFEPDQRDFEVARPRAER